MNKLERGGTVLALAMVASCSGDGTTSLPSIYTAQFTAANDLIAPITIAVDGVPVAILSNGVSVLVTASSRSHVTWTSAKPADSEGHVIPDEIGENEISAAGVNGVFEITNIINDQPYFTASIRNYTSSTVSIGLYDGMKVTCAAVLPAMASATSPPGFVQTGYYRLMAQTELRAYLNPSGCTGSYVTWPYAQLTAYAPKSGLLRVSLVSQ